VPVLRLVIWPTLLPFESLTLPLITSPIPEPASQAPPLVFAPALPPLVVLFLRLVSFVQVDIV